MKVEARYENPDRTVIDAGRRDQQAEKKRAYMREYKRRRYHSDPEYRARTLEDSRLWKVRERARVAA